MRDPEASPYPKLHRKGHHRGVDRGRSASPSRSGSAAVSDAPLPPDHYGEARGVLTSLAAQRDTLETNLQLMLLSRRDVDVYTLMGGAAADR